MWLVFSRAGTVFAFELQRFFALSHPDCCALRDTSGPRCHNAVSVLLHLQHARRRCGWLRDCWHCHSYLKDTVCLIRLDTDVTMKRPGLKDCAHFRDWRAHRDSPGLCTTVRSVA